MKIFEFWMKFHGNKLHEVVIDGKSALIKVMAWHQTGNKPLPESMMTK